MGDPADHQDRPASSSAAEGRPRRSPSRPEPSCCLGTSSRPPTPSIRSWPHLAERTLMPFDAGRFGLPCSARECPRRRCPRRRDGVVVPPGGEGRRRRCRLGALLRRHRVLPAGGQPGARALLLAVLATVWGVRLATHLWARRAVTRRTSGMPRCSRRSPERRFAYAVKRFFVTQGSSRGSSPCPHGVRRDQQAGGCRGSSVSPCGRSASASRPSVTRNCRVQGRPGQQGQDHGPWTLVLDTAPQLLR